MAFLIAYMNNPDHLTEEKVIAQHFDGCNDCPGHIHLVVARDAEELKFICEGDLKGCPTNIFEGTEVKKWMWSYPWD